MNKFIFNKLVTLDKRSFNKSFIKFKLGFNKNERGRVHHIFVIDISASMYNDYKHVLEATDYVSRLVGVEDGKIEEPSVVIYNMKASLCKIGELREYRCGNITNFGAAFEKTAEAIKIRMRQAGEKPTALNIVFMTDGEDTSSEDHSMRMMNFKLLIDNLGIPVKINTVGFRTKAHIDYLNYIKKLGTEEGAFRYAENSSEFRMIDKFAELLDVDGGSAGSACTVKFSMKDGSYKEMKFKGEMVDNYQCVSDESGEGDKRYFKYFGLLPFDCSEVAAIESVTYGKDKSYPFSYEVEEYGSSDEVADGVNKVSEVGMNDLINILALMPSSTKDEIMLVLDMLKSCNVFGKTMINGKGHKIMKFQRDETMSIFDSLRADLDRKMRMIVEAVKMGDTTRMAAIQQDLHDAARHGLNRFTKARFQRKMDERTVKNAGLLRDITAGLERMSSVKDEDMADVDNDFFVCDFQGESITDLMKDEKDEILGFCLQVQIPEHSIDSCNVIVNSVSPTMMTFTTFMDALKYNIGVKGLEKAHGGFKTGGRGEVVDSQSGFEGRGREKINAWLPMYVNDAHFERVKLMLPMVLGQFFTMDMWGFDNSQYLGMFQILGACKFYCKGERMERIVGEYEKICKEIVGKVHERQGWDMVEKFFTGGKDFHEKSVLNNMMTLVGLMAIRDGNDENEEDGFRFSPTDFLVFYEECVRRWFGEKYRTVSPDYVMDIVEKVLYGAHLSEAQGISNKKSDDKGVGTEKAFNMKFNKKEEKEFSDFASVVCGFSKLPKSRSKMAIPVFVTKFPKRNEFVFDSSKCDDVSVDLIVDIMKKFEKSGSGKFCRRVAEIFSFDLENMPNSEKLQGGEYTDVQKLMLKTIMIQALRNYRSFDKGDGSSFIETMSDNGSGKVWSLILENVDRRFKKRRDENWDEYVESFRRKQIVEKMLRTDNMLTFGGMIMVGILGHPTDKFYTDISWDKYNCCTRGGKIFDLIVEGLLDLGKGYVKMRTEKIQQISTGKYFDRERRAEGDVFPIMDNGGAWFASEEMKRRIKKVIGNEAYAWIGTMTVGSVLPNYGYRLSGIPNRQGHSKDNPSEWAICYRSSKKGSIWE